MFMQQISIEKAKPDKHPKRRQTKKKGIQEKEKERLKNTKQTNTNTNPNLPLTLTPASNN